MAAPHHLTDALMGLCLLATERPRAEHPRLVEQFRKNYPEIIALDAKRVKAVMNLYRAANLVLRQSEKDAETSLSVRAYTALAEAVAAMEETA